MKKHSLILIVALTIVAVFALGVQAEQIATVKNQPAQKAPTAQKACDKVCAHKAECTKTCGTHADGKCTGKCTAECKANGKADCTKNCPDKATCTKRQSCSSTPGACQKNACPKKAGAPAPGK